MDKLKAAWAGLPLGLKVVIVAGALMAFAAIVGG